MALCVETVRSVQDCCVTFSLHPIAGTPNFLIRRRSSEHSLVTLVAEIVEYPEGYTLYRMDATGELATALANPDDALLFYEAWARDTDEVIEGIEEG